MLKPIYTMTEAEFESLPDELDCTESPITDYAKVRAWWD